MKILVLGKGFIGERLSFFLAKASDFEVHNINVETLDYTNPEMLSMFLNYHANSKQFDKVIITHGITGKPTIDSCEIPENKPLVYKHNVTIPNSIIDVVNQYGSTCIYIGSGCVYDGYDKEYTETDDPNFGLYNEDSSFYSKTKHLAELTFGNKCHIFRIRLPYTFIDTEKNLFNKLLKYEKTLDMLNSVTCVDDFYNFVYNFLLIDNQTPLPFGPYNVVNPQPIKASKIAELMKEVDIPGASNKKWIFLSDPTRFKFIANRSNTVLNADLIASYGLQLPDTQVSIKNSLMYYKQILTTGKAVIEPPTNNNTTEILPVSGTEIYYIS